MFLAIAHATTLYYYAHVLYLLANANYAGLTDKVVFLFRDNWLKFYTIWCFAAQGVLFLLCVVHDLTRVLLAPGHPARRTAFWLRDLFFTAIAAPVAINVASTFWVLFSMNRDLVMPKAMDDVIPTWMNHALHTGIAVLLLVELVAEKHELPELAHGLLLNLAFGLAYIYVLLDSYFSDGIWLYPMFNQINWTMRASFLLTMLVMTLGSQLIMREVVRVVWRQEESCVRRSQSRVHKD